MDAMYELHKKYSCNENKYEFLNVWHYTNIDGFLGIIKDNSLHFWFTRSDCLNDISEGNHILDLYRRLCHNLFVAQKIDQNFYESIKNIEISSHHFINYPIPPKEGYVHDSILDCVPCDAYICCFSQKEDSLDMWRYYSKGKGGYGLKLYSILFDEYKEHESFEYNSNAIFSDIHSYKVIYDDQEKENILTKLILDVYSAFENSELPDREKEVKWFIASQLKKLQFQFKHNCYNSEQEYRFVYYVPCKIPDNLHNPLPVINFRTHNGMLVPYIEVVVQNGNNYLNDVLISPYEHNIIAKDIAEQYLSKHGFNCKVRLSNLPVRK